jgi:two-component system NtrC family response regulator
MGSLRDARRLVTERFERDYLRALRAATGHDVKKACAVSGLSRARLYELYRKHGILG